MANISITISVPAEVVEFADRMAGERQTSRSRIVTAWLMEHMQRHQAEEMARAYEDWNAENEAITAVTKPLATKRLARVEYDA